MIHSISSKLCLTAGAADSALQHVGANLGSRQLRGWNLYFVTAFLVLETQTRGLLKMADPEKEILSTEAAIVIVGAALALFVGVFLFVSNQYGGTEEAQVAQHDTMPAQSGNELPVAPLTPPPAAPSVTPPSDTPPVTQ